MSRIRFDTQEALDDPETVVIIGDRVMRDAQLTLGPEMVQAIREGYLCIECFEPQQEAFPRVCQASWCAYEMKKNQKADFDRRFRGEDTELYSGIEHDPRVSALANGIWVP
jgi:hypothetical protein